MNVADSGARLALAGLLGVHRYPEFRGAFEHAPRDGPVLVDLREALSADPPFLAGLRCFRRRRRPARTAVLVDAHSEVSRVFALAAIRDKIPVYDDEAEAVDNLTRRPFEDDLSDASAAEM